jgi:hypothetical protein
MWIYEISTFITYLNFGRITLYMWTNLDVTSGQGVGGLAGLHLG